MNAPADVSALPSNKTEFFPEEDALRERARAVFFLYSILFNRNPRPEAFKKCMERLEEGLPLDRLYEELARSDEARRRFSQNLHLRLPEPSEPIEGNPYSWKAEDRPLIVDHPIEIMQIELTNNCPFRCVMCPRTHKMTRDTGLMDINLFKKIIDELVELNPQYKEGTLPIWFHHFGESLTHPDFADFIRYANGKGVGTQMSVNPLMFSKKISQDLIDANPTHLLVAFDGHDNESFEKIRGLPKAYEKSKENLLAFLEQKVASGSKIRIVISIIDFPLNGEKGDEMRTELESFWRSVPGVDDVLWKPFTIWIGDTAAINGLKRPKTEAEQFMQSYMDLRKVTCDFPWKRVAIAWDGGVIPCCHDYNNIYPLGNVKEQSLKEVWNGPKMVALRRELRSGNVKNKLCKDCWRLHTND